MKELVRKNNVHIDDRDDPRKIIMIGDIPVVYLNYEEMSDLKDCLEELLTKYYKDGQNGNII